MKNRQAGLTFVEIMVVVAIIGILTSIAVVGYDSHRKKSRDAIRVTDLENISLALDNWFVINGHFPESIDDLKEYFAEGKGGVDGIRPHDPLNPNEANAPAHPYYRYYNFDLDGVGKYYCLYAKMETGIPSLSQTVSPPISPSNPGCPIDSRYDYVLKGPVR